MSTMIMMTMMMTTMNDHDDVYVYMTMMMTTMIMMTMMMTTMNDHDDDYDDHDDDYDDQTMESRDGCPSMHALTRSHALGRAAQTAPRADHARSSAILLPFFPSPGAAYPHRHLASSRTAKPSKKVTKVRSCLLN